jgi:hypothetical protein
MKLKNCQSDNIFIVGRTEIDSDWNLSIQDIQQPVTLLFQISGIPVNETPIKKICWNFGHTPKVVSITNRKQQPEFTIVSHNFKDVCNETLTIQASVYTPPNVYIATFDVGPFKIKVKKNYIDPEVFKKQIVVFYQTNDLTDELAVSVQQIATRLAFAPNFINYTYREEMIGDALMKMVKALREQKFDPRRGNPFSYFTKIAYHAFCNRIKKEKKSKDTLVGYQDEIYSVLSESGYLPPANISVTNNVEPEYDVT